MTTASTTAPVPTAAPTVPTTLVAIDPAAALLTIADLPAGFVAVTPPPVDPEATLLCGTPRVELVVPSEAAGSARFQDDAGAAFLQHSVSRYADATTADAALEAGRAGVACLVGTSTAPDGTITTFQLQEQVLPAGLGEEAMAYTGQIVQDGQPFSVLVAAVRAGRAVSALQLIVLEGGVAPDALALLATAAARIAPA